ncbi:hypothetical protein AB0N33_00940 [Pseudarthrobacter oxydans]|uniref:hypothetical protein n=1 Tax=Pseudarthrobacter oxydans TaxID=1671 RepID=UPI003417C888
MTTSQHAAPWSMKRIVRMLTGAPVPRRRPPTGDVLTGREAVARALFSDHVQGSKLDLLEYDNEPALQYAWGLEADLHLSVSPEDRKVAAHFGYTIAQWVSFSAMHKVDRREEFALVKGMAS